MNDVLDRIESEEMEARYCKELRPEDTRTVSEYGRDEVVDPGSALTRNYDPDSTPWNTELVNNTHIHTKVRRQTHVKPVQGGGSKGGEVSLSYWLDKLRRFNIGYYWETQDKADDRWSDRFEKILRASSVAAKLPIGERDRFGIGRIIQPHGNLKMLGVIAKGNVASDSLSHIVAEEVHAWPEGKLAAVEGRTSAFQTGGRSYFIYIISNASKYNDQLHRALKNGTYQHWEVKCPGCGVFHAMRTRWDDRRPDLGGLRYDAEGCRLPAGEYNYTKLESTIHYQFPCGYKFWRSPDAREDIKNRSKLSRTGRYGEPTNPGAPLWDRSYTLEAVSIHHIDMMTIIREKHLALKALKNGNAGPWISYEQERECRFYNPEERPNQQRIEITSGATKGLKAQIPDWVARKEIDDGEGGTVELRARFAFADKQRGRASDNEAPHFWLEIRDYGVINGRMKSQLVFEGRIETESELDDTIEEHGAHSLNVGEDSGNETTTVYRHCAKRGYAAFKGDGERNTEGVNKGLRKLYTHRLEDGSKVKRIYDEGTSVDAYLGDPDGRAGQYFVDLFRFCKQSIRDRLHWALTSGEADFEMPADASDNYKEHHQNEELDNTGNWQDYGRRIDLKVCTCGTLLMAEMWGLVGGPLEASKVRTDEIPEEKK